VGYWYECEWDPPADQYAVWDGMVYRCHEQMAGPFATEEEAQAVAEQFCARERAQNPTLWRRRFRVRDIRDRFPGRELLQEGAEDLAAWLPPEQRQPPSA
jgi:hypothetical protein